MESLTIGDLARSAGVGVETVRYYERRGLLEAPPRSESGYRRYSDDAVDRLALIRRAKALGFTLTEIAQLTSVRTPSAIEVVDGVQAKLAEIDAETRRLAERRERLVRLLSVCAEGEEGCVALELDDRGPRSNGEDA